MTTPTARLAEDYAVQLRTELSALMLESGMSQRRISELCHVDHSVISRIMSGTRVPSLALLESIARTLGVRPDTRRFHELVNLAVRAAAARNDTIDGPRRLPAEVTGRHNRTENAAPPPASWRLPPPDPGGARDPGEYLACLRLLRIWAGDPTLRELSDRAPRGALPRSTISDMFRRTDRLPKYGVVKAFVEACGAASEWPRWFLAWQTIAGLSMNRTTSRSRGSD